MISDFEKTKQEWRRERQERDHDKHLRELSEGVKQAQADLDDITRQMESINERASTSGTIEEVLPTSRGNLSESRLIMPQGMSSTGPSDEAKAELRKLIVDTATGDASPTEADVAKVLVLNSKTVEDFRAIVGDLKAFFNQHSLLPMPGLESLFSTEPKDHVLEGLFKN